MRFRILILFYLLSSYVFSTSNNYAQDFSSSVSQNYSLVDTTLAKDFFNRAKSFYDKSIYDSANVYYKKAKTIYNNLYVKTKDQILWEGLIKNYNGLLQIMVDQSMLKDLTKLFESDTLLSNPTFGEDNLAYAQTNFIKGSYFIGLENLDNAINVLYKSLETRKKYLGENHLSVSDCYNSLGVVYARKYYYDKSLEAFKKSFEIKKKLLGEDHPQIAVSYNAFGVIAFDKGDFSEALDYHQKALAIRLKNFGEDNPQTATTYNNLGNVYYNIEEYEKALECHTKALVIRKKKLGDEHSLVSSSYNNIGLVYWKMEVYDSARINHQKALEIRKKVFGESHPSVALSIMNIGVVLGDEGKFDEAIAQYLNALNLWNKNDIDKSVDLSKIYQNLGDLYYRKKEYDSSLFYIQQALISLSPSFSEQDINSNPNLENILSYPSLSNSLGIKAKSFNALAETSGELNLDSRLKNLQNAAATINVLDKLTDKMRTEYSGEGSKLFLGEKQSSVFSLAVKNSLSLQQATNNDDFKQRAFYYIEKSKAVVLQDGLAELRAKQFAKLPADLLQDELELKSELAFLETQLQRELLKKPGRDSSQILNLESKLFDLRQNYNQLISNIEKNYPAYYELKFNTSTVSASELQNILPQKTLVLNYFVGDHYIYIAAVGSDVFEIAQINRPDDLNELIKKFYTSIVKSEKDDYISSATKLSELLIKPISSLLNRKEKLVIVPHDALFKIPFEALFFNNESKQSKNFSGLNYLIKNFDISYHYSATLYINTLHDMNVLKGNHNIAKNFIGFAPVFPKGNSFGYTVSTGNQMDLLALSDDVLRSVSVDGKNFDELKYSEWEVNSIIDLFSKSNPSDINTAYFYADAKEDSFKTNVKDYKIIHIASHSFMNEEQPAVSGVIFAQPNDSTFDEDGILYSGETYNVNLNADLVVLSSCESGLGKLFKGEGMMALTRGFLYSGTSNIVFSLWKIPDKHTSELMVEFYRQMISGKTYSESLRQAKLKLISNEITARPRSWAGFLMIGTN